MQILFYLRFVKCIYAWVIGQNLTSSSLTLSSHVMFFNSWWNIQDSLVMNVTVNLVLCQYHCAPPLLLNSKARTPVWYINDSPHMGTHIVTRMLPAQDAKSFQRAKLLKICEVEEQIMSNDKYAWLFSHQLEGIIFIIFQRAGKMFTNSFHFAAWAVYFSVFSGPGSLLL